MLSQRNIVVFLFFCPLISFQISCDSGGKSTGSCDKIKDSMYQIRGVKVLPMWKYLLNVNHKELRRTPQVKVSYSEDFEGFAIVTTTTSSPNVTLQAKHLHTGEAKPKSHGIVQKSIGKAIDFFEELVLNGGKHAKSFKEAANPRSKLSPTPLSAWWTSKRVTALERNVEYNVRNNISSAFIPVPASDVKETFDEGVEGNESPIVDVPEQKDVSFFQRRAANGGGGIVANVDSSEEEDTRDYEETEKLLPYPPIRKAGLTGSNSPKSSLNNRGKKKPLSIQKMSDTPEHTPVFEKIEEIMESTDGIPARAIEEGSTTVPGKKYQSLIGKRPSNKEEADTAGGSKLKIHSTAESHKVDDSILLGDKRHTAFDSSNIRTTQRQGSLKNAKAGKYHYPPKTDVPLPTCFHNPSGYVCCNLKLNNIVEETYEKLKIEPGFNFCNIQKIAKVIQKELQEKFDHPFESVVALGDFAQNVHFAGDMVCKLEIDGKFIIAYGTPYNADQIKDEELGGVTGGQSTDRRRKRQLPIHTFRM